jgi:hypothetical protein
MMRCGYVIVFAGAFFLNLVDVGFAEEECTKCLQNYTYVCTHNYGQCMEACRSIGTIDKYACQRRCMAADNACSRRATLKCGTCSPAKFAVPPPAHIE